MTSVQPKVNVPRDSHKSDSAVILNNNGLRGRRRTYFTILKRAWSADSKMVR
jgi:hypothetical protein